jgi:hypothetical protein
MGKLRHGELCVFPSSHRWIVSQLPQASPRHPCPVSGKCFQREDQQVPSNSPESMLSAQVPPSAAGQDYDLRFGFIPAVQLGSRGLVCWKLGPQGGGGEMWSL